LRAVTKLAQASNWQLATGNWQLATGNWQLATGNWQLATGNWLQERCMRSAQTRRAKRKGLRPFET
jgi:hypothetical protein